MPAGGRRDQAPSVEIRSRPQRANRSGPWQHKARPSFSPTSTRCSSDVTSSRSTAMPRGCRSSRRSSTGSATRTPPARTPTRPSRGSRTSSSTGTRCGSAASRRSARASPASPTPEERARRIRRFLRQLFNRTYGFNLDALAKKPLKEALKVLQTYEAFSSDYVTATVIQQALGGHAIPIDKDTHRASSGWGSPSRPSRSSAPCSSVPSPRTAAPSSST